MRKIIGKQRRRGFTELIMLVMVLALVLKLYIVYRAWSMQEELIRKKTAHEAKPQIVEVLIQKAEESNETDDGMGQNGSSEQGVAPEQTEGEPQ